MTTHRIPARPYQLSRLRSGERIVLVERVEQPLNPDVRITGSGQTDHDWVWYGADGYFEFRRKPCRPGDVLWFYIADQTEGYMAVIRGEETSWTRTVSSVTAKLGRDVATDLVTQWIAEHAESFYADAWYWITEAT